MSESLPKVIVGVDLTDTYANRPRAVDIAVLETATGQVSFHHLTYPANDTDWANEVAARLAQIAPEGAVLVVDGPQGLAEPQNNSRQVERALRTPAHTPWEMPRPNSRPFAGYIKTSVEFFAALVTAGSFLVDLDGVDATRATLYEAYPGAAWPRLHNSSTGRLESKSTVAGRAQRAEILARLGCRLPAANLTHDQLDACICAALGWKFLQPSGIVSVNLVGDVGAHFDAGGIIREGRMLNPAGTAPPPQVPRKVQPQPPAEPAEEDQTGDPLGTPPVDLPICDWVYYASPSIAGEFETYELAVSEGLICRTVHTNTLTGRPRVANVAQVGAGDTILLAFRLGEGGNGRARPLAVLQVDPPDNPVGPDIAQAVTRILDTYTVQLLTDLGYPRDPQVQPPIDPRTFTAFQVTLVRDLQDHLVPFTPRGSGTIYRWNNAFAE